MFAALSAVRTAPGCAQRLQEAVCLLLDFYFEPVSQIHQLTDVRAEDVCSCECSWRLKGSTNRQNNYELHQKKFVSIFGSGEQPTLSFK